MQNSIIPIVLEPTSRGDRSFDLYSRLLADRIIFLDDPVDDKLSSIIVAQLLFLEAQDSTKDITIYINSGGGSVTAGMGIYDTINYITCDVSTICFAQAASMAAFILSSGTKGKRYALPNAEIMIHQPKGGFGGQVSDVEIHAKRMAAMKQNMTEILSYNCDKSIKEMERATDRDNFMTAKEAVEFGLIDNIMRKRKL